MQVSAIFTMSNATADTCISLLSLPHKPPSSSLSTSLRTRATSNQGLYAQAAFEGPIRVCFTFNAGIFTSLVRTVMKREVLIEICDKWKELEAIRMNASEAPSTEQTAETDPSPSEEPTPSTEQTAESDARPSERPTPSPEQKAESDPIPIERPTKKHRSDCGQDRPGTDLQQDHAGPSTAVVTAGKEAGNL